MGTIGLSICAISTELEANENRPSFPYPTNPREKYVDSPSKPAKFRCVSLPAKSIAFEYTPGVGYYQKAPNPLPLCKGSEVVMMRESDSCVRVIWRTISKEEGWRKKKTCVERCDSQTQVGK